MCAIGSIFRIVESTKYYLKGRGTTKRRGTEEGFAGGNRGRGTEKENLEEKGDGGGSKTTWGRSTTFGEINRGDTAAVVEDICSPNAASVPTQNFSSVALNTAVQDFDATTAIVRYNKALYSDWETSDYARHDGGERSCFRIFDERIGGDNSAGFQEFYGNICIGHQQGVKMPCAATGDNECNSWNTVRIYNNIFIDTQGATIYTVSDYAPENYATTNLYFYNNSIIRYDITDEPFIVDRGNFPASGWHVENNHYWVRGSTPTIDSDWSTGMVTTDPMLSGELTIDWDGNSGVGYFNSIQVSDVYPQIGSGLIDTGRTLVSEFDNLFLTNGTNLSTLPDTINIVTTSQDLFAPWDMGALIYNGEDFNDQF